ncbi:hypothetical protein THIOKS11650014 [Thiocapsa sp. KS1]|nr:hypothetical protein THIOKS11650014 [Thiocapsa sp. KS1]
MFYIATRIRNHKSITAERGLNLRINGSALWAFVFRC